MGNRTLLLVFLVLLGLDFITRPNPGGGRVIGPLLEGFSAADAARIELRRDGEAALLLEVKDGAWVLPGAKGYPARQELVRDFLARLASLSTQDLVSADGREGASQGLDQGVLIKVLDQNGAPLAELLQGAATQDGSASFGRLPGDPRIWRLTRLLPLRLSSAQWLDAVFAPFEPGLVRGLELQGGPRSRSIRRDPARADLFRDEGEQPLPGEKVSALLKTLQQAFVGEVLDATELAGEEAPWRVQLDLPAGPLIVLFRMEENGTVAATRVGTGFRVSLSADYWALLEDRIRALLP